MSSKKGMSRVVATLLGAVVLFVAGQASAQATTESVTFAWETLSSESATIDDYFDVTAATSTQFAATTDFALLDDTRYFVRYNFEGGVKLRAELTSLEIAGADETLERVYRGGVEDEEVVLLVENASGYPINTDFVLKLGSHFAIPEPAEGSNREVDYTFTFAIYSSDQDARNEQNPLYETSSASIIRVRKAVDVMVTANTATADAASSAGAFLRFEEDRFSGGDYTDEQGALARIAIETELGSDEDDDASTPDVPYRNAANGEPVTDADVFTGMSMTFTATSSAFAFGTYSVGSPACDAANELTIADGDDVNQGTAEFGTDASSAQIFCVSVADNEMAIPVVDSYQLEYELTSGGSSGTVPAGAITRNGTVVNIAFLTTASNYNQRLAFVNHGDEMAMYTCQEFQSEVNVEVMDAGEGLDGGVIQPGARRVFKMFESGTGPAALTITGGARTAATCTFTGVRADQLSVMTIQFNRESGALDTTRYEPIQN